jgi:hypothetical protein
MGGCSYPLADLEKVRATEDLTKWWILMEGDWGGQVYLTIPLRLVTASPSAVMEVLKLIDSIAWDCNEGEGAEVYLKRAECGKCIGGGMGGGIFYDRLWLHPEFSFGTSDGRSLPEFKDAINTWLTTGVKPDSELLTPDFELPYDTVGSYHEAPEDWNCCQNDSCPQRSTCNWMDGEYIWELDCDDTECCCYAECRAYFDSSKRVLSQPNLN